MGVTQNAAQFPLPHVTYSGTKFEVAMANSLGGNMCTRNVTFDLEVKVTQTVAQYLLHHETYLCTKFEVAMSNRFRRRYIYKKCTDEHTDRRTMDRLWYIINIPFFLKKKSRSKSVETSTK